MSNIIKFPRLSDKAIDKIARDMLALDERQRAGLEEKSRIILDYQDEKDRLVNLVNAVGMGVKFDDVMQMNMTNLIQRMYALLIELRDLKE